MHLFPHLHFLAWWGLRERQKKRGKRQRIPAATQHVIPFLAISHSDGSPEFLLLHGDHSLQNVFLPKVLCKNVKQTVKKTVRDAKGKGEIQEDGSERLLWGRHKDWCGPKHSHWRPDTPRAAEGQHFLWEHQLPALETDSPSAQSKKSHF